MDWIQAEGLMVKKKPPPINIIDPKDPKALYVARQKAGLIFVGLSPRTLGNMASLKICIYIVITHSGK